MNDEFFVDQLRKKIWAFPTLIFFGGIGVWAEGTREEVFLVLGMAAISGMLWFLLIKFSDKASHKEFITALACICCGLGFQMTLKYVFNSSQNEERNLWLSCISLGSMILITYLQIKKVKNKLWNLDTIIFDECAARGNSSVVSQSTVIMCTLAAMHFTDSFGTDTKEIIGFYALLFSAISFLSLGIWHLGHFVTTVKLNREYNVSFRDKYLLLLRQQKGKILN